MLDWPADQEPPELVVADVVAAQQVLAGRFAQVLAEVRVDLVGGVEDRPEEAEQDDEDHEADRDERQLVLGEHLPAAPEQATRLGGWRQPELGRLDHGEAPYLRRLALPQPPFPTPGI